MIISLNQLAQQAWLVLNKSQSNKPYVYLEPERINQPNRHGWYLINTILEIRDNLKMIDLDGLGACATTLDHYHQIQLSRQEWLVIHI